MANEVNQKNHKDIALELTQIYLRQFPIESLKDMQDVYTRFYATSVLAENKKYEELEELTK